MTAYTARALSTDRLQNVVEYANHDFAVGTILGWDGSTWFLSIANSDLNSQVVGMVSVVLDANNFVITQVGFVSNLPLSYTAGDEYYLSPSVPGALTNVKPVTPGEYVVALFIPYTLHTGYFAVTPGVEVLGSPGIFVWHPVTTNTVMVGDNGYFVETNSTLTLPAASGVGDIIEITNFGASGFTVAQTGSSQQISGLGASTTPGSSGSVVATYNGSSVRMVCLVANTSWQILSGTADLQFN